MVGNDILKIERGRGFSGLAEVRATTRARVTTMLIGVTMMLALLLAMPSAALAQGTEQSETITTTCESQTFGLTVEGTHFTIKNGSNVANLHGIEAHVTKGGITVTAKNSERITKVVITCEYHPEEVTDNNISVSSGTMTISDGGKTITVKNVNATTFNLNSSEFTPFSQFVVYYLTYKVSLKEGTVDADNWKPKAGTGEAKALPLEGVAEGEKVTLQYEGRKRVMSVRATKKVATWDGDLAKLKGWEPEGYATATDGMTITGTLADGVNVKVTIAAGATVTLSGATIEGKNVDNAAYMHAGITCLGNATIVLSGTNAVKGFEESYPGIHVPEGKTLTIRGDGSLDASSNGRGCGIGGSYGSDCGNITIEGGSITATGGEGAAGIGGGFNAECGDISITGGTVVATGGDNAAGIGSGLEGSCGKITITSGVTKVTATAGNYATFSIGKGEGSYAKCGTVTIGGKVYWNGSGYANGGDTYLTQSPLIYEP